MKKTLLKLCSAVLALCLLFTAAGCGSDAIEHTDEFGEKYKTAVENSLKADIYFIKESKNADSKNYSRRINVLPALEGADSVPVKRAEGGYEDLKISIDINDFDGSKTFIRCGKSAGNPEGDYRFIRTSDKDNNVKSATYKPAEPNAWYKSEEFKNHRLSTLIAELTEFTYDDMNFSIEGAEQKTMGKVTTFIFAPTEEYLKAYEAKHGEKSLFDGASRVLIETAYDRISNVTVYVNEAVEGSSFSVETEKYKLEVVYLGPKIKDIPKYDETDSKTKKPIWSAE